MASSLSDDELRRKLLEYGENFPVTDTNRRILLNKLKKLESGDRNRSRSSSRRSLLGFSSDESETEVQRPKGGSISAANGKTGNSSIDAGAAITSSASTINPLRRSRRSRTSLLSGDSSFANDSSSPSSFSPSRHSIRRNSTSSTDTFAKSDGNETKSPFKVPLAANDRSSLSVAANVSRRRSRTSSSSYTSKSKTVPQSHPKLDTSGSDSDISDSSISNIPENRGVNEFPRSRRSFISTSDWSSPTQSAKRHDGNKVDLQDYRRPSYYSSVSAKLHANGHHDVIDTSLASTGGGGGEFESSASYGGSDAHHNSQCVSKFLVAVVVLFFAIVGLIYLGARNKDLVPSFGNEADLTSLVTPICSSDSKEVSCIVANAANHLKNILRHRAGEVECSNVLSSKDRHMSFDEAQRNVEPFLKSDGSIGMGDILRIFLNMSQWGVRLMNETGADVDSKADLWQVYWVTSDVSELSLACRLKLAFRNTVYKASLLLASVITFVVLGYSIYYYWDWKRREREEIFALVEKILDVLQNHNRACQNDSSAQPYLAIPHVRDMLIPPIERKSKRGIWDGAVRFIQNNESRVRFEVQVVEGEDFTVWRWLQADSPSSGGKSGNRSMRIWQGQAFEQLDSGINALPCSPTPCLKVRNMFDPDVEYEENWPVHIHDAILDKCDCADIVHLQVDSASREGCVYIKCKDSETAGIVYRLLHGWWFDGKLVTVKYLRVERYHDRFPEAVRCVRYLRPIGTVVSSSSSSSSGHTMLRRSAVSST